LRPALFLDRDGVINHDSGYTHIWDESLLIDGICELINYFRKNEHLVIVVTNQSGIGRGIFNEGQYEEFMKNMGTALQKRGADLDAAYHCRCLPCVPMCPNRKPNPGMILKAASDYEIALDRSTLIGDKATDILAARSANIQRRYLYCDPNSTEHNKLEGVRYRRLKKLTDLIQME